MDYAKYKGRGVRKVDNATRPITFLDNNAEWVENIYCLEAEDNIYTADLVLGSRDGVANAPIQALANCTNYLKEIVMKVLAYFNALQNALSAQLDNVKAAIIQKPIPMPTNTFGCKPIARSTPPKSPSLSTTGASLISPFSA